MQTPIEGQKMNKRPEKLLDQVRDTIRLKHYSMRTEEAYIVWIKRYILFHDERHPCEMGSAEIEHGIYLYVVTARSFNGRAIRSEVRKLVVLR